MEEEMKIWAKLGKYVSANMEEEEKKAFEAWLVQHPEYQEQVSAIERIWKTAEKAEPQIQPKIEDAWTRFATQKKASSPIRKLSESHRNSWTWKQWTVLAASFALLASLSFWWLTPISEENKLLTFQTEKEVQKLSLPDSTQVWLNQFSTITYLQASGERKLTLEGEAFFQVKRDESQPFIIQSGKLSTQVLGTSFNLRAYPKEEHVFVRVESGKVSFGESTKKPVILTQGKGGSFDKVSSHLKTFKLHRENRNAWITQKLSFDNERMEQVIADIEEYFHIDLEVENTDIMACHFTSSFIDPDLEDLLAVIQFALDVKVEEQNGIFRIMGKGCN